MVLVISYVVVYSGFSDGVVNYWEMGEKKVLKYCGVFKKYRFVVFCFVVVGELVFSGVVDKKICVWRREGRVYLCVLVLIGYIGLVKCLVVVELLGGEGEDGGDGRLIVYSGSFDKLVKVWRVLCYYM